MLSNKKGVQLIVNILAQAGIKNVVLSPGSRNAPLSLSFHHHDFFESCVIPDERSAAYFALGISQFTSLPTILVCTSGTAVLNYAPAIAEAYYQKISLIVLTADRPTKWIDQGDGQTIRQENVFANYIQKSYSVNGDASTNDDLKPLNEIMTEAIHETILFSAPVHINITLEEPLYLLDESKIESGFHQLTKADNSFQLGNDLKNIWESASKVLILVGQQMKYENIENELNILTRKGVVVLCETTSNLHGNFISCIDRTIDSFSEEEKTEFKPDLLITIGGAVISKKVKSFFRQNAPEFHWNVHPYNSKMNTYECLTHALSSDTELFLNRLNALSSEKEKSFFELWMSRSEKNYSLHQSFLKDCPFTDLKLFDILGKHLPKNQLLHLGNSSTVRYQLLFNSREDLVYFSNRGVSGIDGSSSTAAGMAFISGKQVTLISGDISFFYDSNALWNDYLKNIKIIVINNGGGGIFRIIDRPSDITDTERLFETRHQRSVKGVVEAFQLKYFSANNEESLILGIENLYEDDQPGVLEVFTPTELNAETLKKYFEFIKTK